MSERRYQNNELLRREYEEGERAIAIIRRDPEKASPLAVVIAWLACLGIGVCLWLVLLSLFLRIG